jgi:hypothetical protein
MNLLVPPTTLLIVAATVSATVSATITLLHFNSSLRLWLLGWLNLRLRIADNTNNADNADNADNVDNMDNTDNADSAVTTIINHALILEREMIHFQTIYNNSFTNCGSHCTCDTGSCLEEKKNKYYNMNSSQNIQYFKDHCILECETPNGFLKMIYNPFYDGFIYSSKHSINNKYLYLCTLHYVIKYKCRDLLYNACLIDSPSLKLQKITEINKCQKPFNYIRVKKLL